MFKFKARGKSCGKLLSAENPDRVKCAMDIAFMAVFGPYTQA